MSPCYHIWKCSVPCESFRRLRNRNLRLAFHSLSSPIHRYKKARCECHVKCPARPPIQHECLIPSQNIAYRPKNSANPQDGQPSPQGNTKIFENDVPSLSLWSKALGDLSLQMSPRPHNLPIHDRRRIYTMTPRRAITSTVLPQSFLDIDIQLFLQKGQCIAEPFWRASGAWSRSGSTSLCPEIGAFTSFSEPLRGVKACLSFASLNGCENVQRECYTFSSTPRKREVRKYRSESDSELNVVIFRTAARSMKKKDGHAEILSSKLRKLGKPELENLRNWPKHQLATSVEPKKHFGKWIMNWILSKSNI